MQLGNISEILEKQTVTTSAPCRIDFGGTLDISSFHYPLKHLRPSTVNIALDLRTKVTLRPNDEDTIRISSAGFEEAAFSPNTAPYNHPLGFMFALADVCGVSGVHIQIESTSPPQSGLGGSSVAAVALVAAFGKAWARMGHPEPSRQEIALLTHAVEQGVAGVPCGMQDQLGAAYGGVHAWSWPADPTQPPFVHQPLLDADGVATLNQHLLVAYLGVTHVSAAVNNTWIRQFTAGEHRDQWHEIIHLTHQFAEAIQRMDMAAAAAAMNRETAIRKTMTPQVLEEMGERLAAAAIDHDCGARFTGAGAGGCLWALGEAQQIDALRSVWAALLAQRPTAGLLDCRVDPVGAGD